MSSKLLTVIIPTIGRSQLLKTVQDINSEFDREEVKILIIAQSQEVRVFYENLYDDEFNVLVLLNPNAGVSAALNLGLEHWDRSTWLSIFSDDDIWLSGRKAIINSLSSQKNKFSSAVFGSCRIKRDIKGRQSSLRKPNIVQGQSPLHYVYPKLSGMFKNHYLTLTSLVIPPNLINVKFRQELISREDIFWLEENYESGLLFSCMPQFVLSEIYPGHERTIERDSKNQIEVWLKILRERQLDEVVNNFFLLHYPKPFIRTGNLRGLIASFLQFREVIEVNRALKLLVYIIQISLTLAFKTLNRMKALFLKRQISLIIKPKGK